MIGRILFLVIWGIISLVVFLINPVWGVVVFFIGFLVVALVVSSILGSSRRSQSQDINIHVTDDRSTVSRKPQRRSPIQTGMDWHVPKVNKDGVDFITGARSLRKSQEDGIKRTKKRLWG